MRLFNHISNNSVLSIPSILPICLYLDISLRSMHLYCCICHQICAWRNLSPITNFIIFYIFCILYYHIKKNHVNYFSIVASLRRPCVNLMRMLSGRRPTARNSGTGFMSLSVGERHCSIRLRTPQWFPAAAGDGLASGDLGLRI